MDQEKQKKEAKSGKKTKPSKIRNDKRIGNQIHRKKKAILIFFVGGEWF
jgi:hypothetical protein